MFAWPLEELDPPPPPPDEDDPPDDPLEDPPEFDAVCWVLPELGCALPDPLWPLSAVAPPLLPELDDPVVPDEVPPDEPEDADEEPLPELPEPPLDGFSGSSPLESLVG